MRALIPHHGGAPHRMTQTALVQTPRPRNPSPTAPPVRYRPSFTDYAVLSAP